jgi:small subunit ribosomal protein S24e
MEVKIVSQKENPLLKRKEIQFQVDHEKAGGTPARLEIRKAVADALKANTDLVFVKRFETKTGTNRAFGVANLYDSVEQAELVEPEYVIKRNIPPQEPKEEDKEQK